MSYRTLVELNHDTFNPEHARTIDALSALMASAGSERNLAAVEAAGVHVFGTRHHSEGYDIRWGSNSAAAPETNQVVDRNCTPLRIGDEVVTGGHLHSKIIGFPDGRVLTTASAATVAGEDCLLWSRPRRRR